MVLRLRGGGWSIQVFIPNGKILTVDGPPDQFPVAGIYAKIYQAYPHIKKSCIALTNSNRLLDPRKTIKDYGISHTNTEVYAIIPEYFFGTQAIIKLMKIGGYWEHDQKIIEDLSLLEEFKEKLEEYGKNPKKAMTAVIVNYLEETYPEEMDELKLVIQKAQKFLKK